MQFQTSVPPERLPTACFFSNFFPKHKPPSEAREYGLFLPRQSRFFPHIICIALFVLLDDSACAGARRHLQRSRDGSTGSQVANLSAIHGKGMSGTPKQESTYITLTIADNGICRIAKKDTCYVVAPLGYKIVSDVPHTLSLLGTLLQPIVSTNSSLKVIPCPYFYHEYLHR